MAFNTTKKARKKIVKRREEVYNPKTDSFVSKSSMSGQFNDNKENNTPFKGTSKEGTRQLAPVFRKLRQYDEKR